MIFRNSLIQVVPSLLFSKLAVSYSDHFLSQDETDGGETTQLREAALSAALNSVDLPVSNNQGKCLSDVYVQI